MTSSITRKIPTRPDSDLCADMVARVVAAYRAATPAQIAEGRMWYPQAHAMAHTFAGDPIIGAGVFAALSPNTPWGRNVTLAAIAFRDGKASGSFGIAVDRANRIMRGEDPHDVLPTGLKTWHFFRAIADPSDPHAAVIDRHAHDIAVGARFGKDDRGLDNLNRYNALAGVYRAAGDVLGEPASVVQAVTWVAYRESLTERRGVESLRGAR